LHRFQDTAFERSKIAIFGLRLATFPPTEGLLGTISVKFYLLPKVSRRSIAEYFNRLSHNVRKIIHRAWV